MYETLDSILELTEEERNKRYLENLKSKIESDENKDELQKKAIITDEGAIFIHSYQTKEEYEKTIAEVGKDGYHYHTFCTNEEILRILNPRSSEDILLKKQADYIADHMRTRRVFYKRKEIYESKSKEWSLYNYYNEDKLFSQYFKKLKPHLKLKCKNVPIGYVFMPEPNGICERTDFGNIIYLSESLRYFLFYMNYVFLSFNGVTLDNQTKSDAFFIGLRVMLGVESLDFDLDPRHDTLPSHIIDTNNDLVNSQIMFIIGHEYAHHTLGHLRSANTLKVFPNELNFQKAYNYFQKQEFEADWYSFKNIKATKDEKTEILNGAFLFFIYIDIYNIVRDYLLPSNNKYQTHPNPLDRLWKLRKRITNDMGFSRKELELFIQDAQDYKDFLINEALPYKSESFEFKGSIYLSNYKTKKLIDRIDF